MHTHERPLLDTIRWMSAGLVAVGHAIGMLIAPVGAEDGLWEATIFRFVGDLRGPAVILFFVLSGYLVGGGILLRRDRFRWREYFIARFSRIYSVLIPAILLIIALDYFAHIISPFSPVYIKTWAPGSLGQEPVINNYHPINFFATLVGLAGIIAKPIGTGGPLWSLGNEWLFYFLFPTIVIVLRRWKSFLHTVGGAICVIILFAVFGNMPTAAFFLIWCMGAFARLAVSRRLIPQSIAIAGGLVAIGSFFASGVIHHRIMDVILGTSFAIFLTYHAQSERGLSRRVDIFLANSSYSLYVCHLTVMAFITMLLHRAGLVPSSGLIPIGVNDTFKAIALLLILIFPSLFVAWIFARLFEERTERVRLGLDRIFSSRGAST